MARQQKQAAGESIAAAAPPKSLFERVAGYLDANDWNYTADEEKGYFSASCRLKDGSVRIILDVAEAEDWRRVLVYSTFPVYVPQQRRAAAVEGIARINYTMIYGNLEIDLADGEVRVRTVVEAVEPLGDAMIERALGANLDIAGRYYAALLAVAFGGASPESVLELAAPREAATVQ